MQVGRSLSMYKDECVADLADFSWNSKIVIWEKWKCALDLHWYEVLFSLREDGAL